MLSRLSITNYALIDHIDIAIDKGMTILTGETGAGKSIIMGALSLILGERADSKSIRDKEKKSVVEATFDISNFDLKSLFEENDIDYYPEECIIRKEFSDNGRSRVFINDSPVSVSLLKEITPNLIDIHSQNSNQLVLKSSYQLNIIDSIADNKAILEDYKAAFLNYKKLCQELDSAISSFQKNKADEDYLRFQFNQLDVLKLEKGEDVVLEALQKKLSNVSEIKELLWTAESHLNGDEGSILDRLQTSTKSVYAASENLIEAKELADRLDSAMIELKDIAMAISQIQDGLEVNPDELERINERLNAIYALETKHSVSSVDELIEMRETLRGKLEEVENSDEHIKSLEKAKNAAYNDACCIADELSATRKKAAEEFEANLLSIVCPLGLKNVNFKVLIKQKELALTGSDEVRFMVAFNKNQDLMPIEFTASGGELSRLMLSIKTLIAQRINLPTIIFDEVDTGVSGDVADKIGDMMLKLSNRIQVLAITHLPQVAAQGDHHLKVFKTDTENSTVTAIKKLDGEGRIYELASMLSGSTVTQSAIENAKTLLKNKI